MANDPAPLPPLLGLIGGLGPAATVFYYRALLEAHAKRGLTPRMLIAHADLARVLTTVADGRLPELTEYLTAQMQMLETAGARVTAIAAVTPHICAPALTAGSQSIFVDIVAEISATIRARGCRRVALFGTRFTMESRLFGRLHDVEVAPLLPAEFATVHAVYMEIVAAGTATPLHTSTLAQIGQAACQRGADAIILAGTELSLAFNTAGPSFPAIDASRVHIQAILRELTTASKKR